MATRRLGHSSAQTPPFYRDSCALILNLLPTALCLLTPTLTRCAVASQGLNRLFTFSVLLSSVLVLNVMRQANLTLFHAINDIYKLFHAISPLCNALVLN